MTRLDPGSDLTYRRPDLTNYFGSNAEAAHFTTVIRWTYVRSFVLGRIVFFAGIPIRKNADCRRISKILSKGDAASVFTIDARAWDWWSVDLYPLPHTACRLDLPTWQPHYPAYWMAHRPPCPRLSFFGDTAP